MTRDLDLLPTPAGPVARMLGCDCPMLEPHDQGYTLTDRSVRFPKIRGRVYVVADDCPVHGLEPS